MEPGLDVQGSWDRSLVHPAGDCVNCSDAYSCSLVAEKHNIFHIPGLGSAYLNELQGLHCVTLFKWAAAAVPWFTEHVI